MDQEDAAPALPQMDDVVAQPYRWKPYLMRQGAGGFRSPSLNTDAHGFRLSIGPEGPLGVDELHRWRGRRGVVIGNSALYGVGVSHDGATLPSWFNTWGAASGWRWFNLSLRASVLWQERQVLELYLPERVDALWWISGVNDLVAANLGGGDPYLPPFIGQPAFEQRMNGDTCGELDEAAALRAARERLKVTLAPLARLQDEGVAVGFVLQPLFTWLEKRAAPEETLLIRRFDASPSRLHRAHRAARMGPLYSPWLQALDEVCRAWGIPFADANACPTLRDDAWLFVDRIHLNDRGHYRLGRWLWEGMTPHHPS